MLALLLTARVAVMVADPAGHGDQLARAVAEHLRADGWEAVVVAAPRGRIDLPKNQDEAAKRVTATHVLAIDLYTHRQRTTRGGQVRESYPPPLRVWRFDVENMPEAMRATPVEQPGPTLPPSATHAPRLVEEEIRALARLMWRPVGAGAFTIDRQLGAGALTGWREDAAPQESESGIAHEARLWQGLLGELAAETAEAIEMR